MNTQLEEYIKKTIKIEDLPDTIFGYNNLIRSLDDYEVRQFTLMELEDLYTFEDRLKYLRDEYRGYCPSILKYKTYRYRLTPEDGGYFHYIPKNNTEQIFLDKIEEYVSKMIPIYNTLYTFENTISYFSFEFRYDLERFIKLLEFFQNNINCIDRDLLFKLENEISANKLYRLWTSVLPRIKDKFIIRLIDKKFDVISEKQKAILKSLFSL